MLNLLVAGYGAILLATTVLALVKRLRWLLIACLTVALGWLATIVLTVHGWYWNHPQWGIFIADTAVLISFSILTVRYRNRWLIWAAGLQAAAVALHIAYALDPALSGDGYAGAGQILGWGVMDLLLVAGVMVRSQSRAALASHTGPV